MPSTFTPLLRLTKPGLNDTGWGTTVNNGTFELIDNSIAGLVSVDVTSGNATLTTANGATDEARYMFVRAFGASVARDVVVPATSKLYFVVNDCTAAVTFKASGQPGVSVPAGRTAVLRCNGTDVVAAVTYLTELVSGGTVTGTKIIPTGNVTAGNGMYLPATNTLAWSTNGAEGMRLDSSGNLGIGTSSPGYKMTVAGTGGSATVSLLETGVRSWGIRAGGATTNTFDIADFTAGASRLAIDSAGNLGVGTSSPAEKLAINQGNIYALRTGGAKLRLSDQNNEVSVESSPTGLVSSMVFKTSTTTQMTLDASGNLGLGVTPSAWGSGLKSLQLGNYSALTNNQGGFTWLSNNAYYDSAWKYLTTNRALYYAQDTADGGHKWFTAPSGTAGNAISFTQAMTLDASGNLGIGIAPSGARLDMSSSGATYQIIRSPSTFASSLSLAGNGSTPFSGSFDLQQDGSSIGYIINRANQPILLLTNSTERARITSTGLVGIGTSSPAASLDVNGGVRAIQGLPTSADLSNVGFSFGPDGDTGMFSPTTGGAASGTLVFFNNGTERARITSGGKLLVNTTDNGYPSFFLVQQATSADECASFWNSATSGDNNIIKFYTDAGQGRGSITYNRSAGLIAYNTTSDYRAKDILGPVANPGATIDALKVYIGKMKGATVERPMLVAHEAQEVAPYAVTGQKDEVNDDGTPKYQQMDASTLVPLLIAEIQSLRARVAALEAR